MKNKEPLITHDTETGSILIRTDVLAWTLGILALVPLGIGCVAYVIISVTP